MLTSSRQSSRQSGFTLIEAAVAVTIVAVVFALAAPAIDDWLLNAQIRTAAESIQNGLQRARSEAVYRNAPIEFILGADSSWQYRVVQKTYQEDGTTLPPHTTLQRRPSTDGSMKVVVTAYDLNGTVGATTTTFDGLGRRWGDPASGKNLDAAAGAGSNQMASICVDLPPAALAKTRTRNLEIDISLSGDIRMCDPEVSLPDVRACPITPPAVAPICKD